MTMYYPRYRQQGDENGIDVKAVRQSIVVCISLISLLNLQYVNDGHMDELVYELFSDRLHAVEQLLSDTLEAHLLEDLPF